MFKGDNQVPLGDICNIEKGATITRNDVLPGEVPVVAGGQEPSCYHNVANREAGAITVSASALMRDILTSGIALYSLLTAIQSSLKMMRKPIRLSYILV